MNLLQKCFITKEDLNLRKFNYTPARPDAQWVNIPTLEGIQASTDGRIRTTPVWETSEKGHTAKTITSKVLQPKGRRGNKVYLPNNTGCFNLYRLIASAFFFDVISDNRKQWNVDLVDSDKPASPDNLLVFSGDLFVSYDDVLKIRELFKKGHPGYAIASKLQMDDLIVILVTERNPTYWNS